MLVAPEITKDLGSVTFGRPISFSFQVQNQGTIPLQIKKVAVGCHSCTTANVVKTKLEPSEISDIQVLFTPGSTGKQIKFINVRWQSDTGEEDVLKLTFTAISHV